jgi:hypothetical protein
MIERDIVASLITSSEYLNKIINIWDIRFLKSTIASNISKWCIEYYQQYNEAPKSNIEKIYLDKLKNKKISLEDAEFIEQVLENLTEEFEQVDFNLDYIYTKTKQYFTERKIELQQEAIERANTPEEKEKELLSYQPLKDENESDLDIFNPNNKDTIESAFKEHGKTLIKFKGALGDFLSPHLIPGNFISFLGKEKVGKSQLLMGLVMESLRNGNDTAFFQAGDMTENQMIRRIGIHLCQNSDMQRYCRPMYIPVVDCIDNQIDNCASPARMCNFGVCMNIEEMKEFDSLIEKHHQFPGYSPCRNCEHFRGSVWLKKREQTNPITWKDSYKAFINFRKKYPAKFKLSTHPADTLSVSKMKSILKIWEREGFKPKVIVVDYFDIMASDPDTISMISRDQINKKWMRLRGLSGEGNYLLIGATQADSDSYEKDLLTMKNFSNDKRILSHPHAIFGINKTDEEAEIGKMRLNEIVIREGKSNSKKPITILQRLEIGQPFLDSYF